MLKNASKIKTSALLNTDNLKYAFIDEKLFLSFQKLIKVKFIRKYDKKIDVAITHVIFFIIIVNKRQKNLSFLLITKLKNYELILKKSWKKNTNLY